MTRSHALACGLLLALTTAGAHGASPTQGEQALRAAVDNGADCVYMGLRDDTNARNFSGLNFSVEETAAAVSYAHARGAKVLLAVNTFAAHGVLQVRAGDA